MRQKKWTIRRIGLIRSWIVMLGSIAMWLTRVRSHWGPKLGHPYPSILVSLDKQLSIKAVLLQIAAIGQHFCPAYPLSCLSGL